MLGVEGPIELAELGAGVRAARLVAGEGGGATSRASGYGSRASVSRSCALRSRPASAQTALRVSRVGASIGSPA